MLVVSAKLYTCGLVEKSEHKINKQTNSAFEIAQATMMSEIDELAGYKDTLEAMEEELSSWTKGRETQTLDILIDMLDSMQKDQVLKKEAEDFAQQVMEEVRHIHIHSFLLFSQLHLTIL